MKTKLILLFLLLTSYCLLLTAQIPQGFNYQAIARDGVDPITTPIGVKITIQSASGGGTLFWVEEHLLVQPNSSGLFSLVIGQGTRLSGTATTFSGIDWTVTPKFIKTEINNGGGYVTMGTSQLWSVPYSTVAGDLKGTLDKLSVKGETTNVEEALFEVKNKDGQTILAVYNEGVRIYVADGSKGSKGGFAIGGFGASKADTPGQQYFIVNRDSIRAYIWDDPLVKAPKGGFAIGGFGSAKTFTNDYMMISPDSARIYINNASSTKGKKGGFAIGGFGAAKRTDPQRLLTVSDDSIRMYIDDNSKASKGGFAIGGFGSSKGPYKNFLNVATDATGIVNPAQNKILWYPIKNAFLSGQILIHHPDSIGTNSTTTGFESRAKGIYSQAMGYKAMARGQYSTAIGKNAVAHKDNSFAFGENSYAGNTGSFALGYGSKATGLGSFALGFEGKDSANNLTGATVATGSYSMSFGMGAKSTAKGSLAMGTMSEATFEYSTAIGYLAKALNWYSTSVGYKTKAYGKYSSAFGFNSRADGESATALGWSSAEGKLSVAFGRSYASGEYAIAGGNSSVASGNNSFALGETNSAIGGKSVALGSFTFARGISSFASGQSTIAEADYAHAFGINNLGFKVLPAMDITDPLFNPVLEVGNGTSVSARTNAMTVLRNGQVLIGTHNAQFIEDQIMFNDPPHALNITGRKPWTDEGYYGLFVKGETQIDGNIVPYIVNNYSIGSATAPWQSVYASSYYGNGASATFYADLIPNGTRNIGSSTYRWNTAYVNTYYGNSSNVATFSAAIVPNATNTRNLGSSSLRWNAAYISTYYGNSSGNAVFAAAVLPSGTQNLGSTSAYWANLYGRKITLDGSAGLTEFIFTEAGAYAGAFGYNNTDNYMYIYQGDNFVFKGGNFGIGNTAPGQKLDINGGNGRVQTGYSWLTNSDVRYKSNITALTNSLEKVMNLRGVRFDLVDDIEVIDGSGKYIGFIAQELEQLFPEFVVTGSDGYKSVSYDKMTAVLVEAVKEQQQQIEASKQENLQLKSELQSLKAEMEQIKALVTVISQK